jgi:hypothetical protein
MNKTKIALGLEQGDPPLWREIVYEIVSISEEPELTKPNREFLFTLINFEGKFIIDHTEIHDGPHCMSPEDMSKSLALQTLAKFGDFYSVNIFEVLKIKFENHATLKSIAEACAEQVREKKNNETRDMMEFIPEESRKQWEARMEQLRDEDVQS